MSTIKRSAVQQLDAFMSAYFEDLQEDSEPAFLGDLKQVEAQRAAFDKLIDAASMEAGKRRLSRAKRALAAISAHRKPLEEEAIDLAVARRYIAEAANDTRITLAARDLIEMSDEEVERIYSQLKELESSRYSSED